MKIGELATRTGCPVETIRYYEREGLLPAPRRSAANYRLYGDSHLERLDFIRHCRALDMTLNEIRALLEHHDRPGESCEAVNDLIDEHLVHVEVRLDQLARLKGSLVALRARCNVAAESRDCGILQELSRPVEAEEEGKGEMHVPGAHR